MKVLRFITFLIVFSLGMILIPERAYAEVIRNAWVESSQTFCDSSSGLNNISINQIKGDSTQQISNFIEENQLCTISVDIDIWEVQDSELRFCPPSHVIPQRGSGEYNQYCCLRGAISTEYYANYCCPENTSDYEVSDESVICLFNDGTSPLTVNTPRITTNNFSTFFRRGTSLFECPVRGCLTDPLNAVLQPNNTQNNPLRESEKANYECYADGSEHPNDPNLTCLNNAWLTEEQRGIVEEIGRADECLKFNSSTERTRCLECFQNNIDAAAAGKPQTYVYSSLGCIDTNRDPFITRLFQIGFGTLGGLAVARIMWGAVKRQSTDPAKIQEGRDLILSAIAALVMLAATFPLLRYIGINLTGLLPVSFFN